MMINPTCIFVFVVVVVDVDVVSALMNIRLVDCVGLCLAFYDFQERNATLRVRVDEKRRKRKSPRTSCIL